MKLAVLGAGAWGTALAAHAVARSVAHNDVWLWARRPEQAQALLQARCNDAYLPGVRLPAALQVSSDLRAALAHGAEGLTVIATPMSGLRQMLSSLADAQPVVWLAKGFEQGSGELPHEIAQQVLPAAPCAVLTGPSFADEVARGQPTALVAAGADAALLECVVQALHSDSLRIYTSDDLVGAEVGGAVKNVLAIATGIADGLADVAGRAGGAGDAVREAAGPLPPPGLNARAALITRGLSEMTRLGLALGARPETFMGLSGLGDLVLTATGALSRNRRVGLRLAQGLPLAQVLAELGHVAEGVHCAATVVRRARSLGVDMPLCSAVVDVLQGTQRPQDALVRLMSRQPRAERSID